MSKILIAAAILLISSTSYGQTTITQPSGDKSAYCELVGTPKLLSTKLYYSS